MKNKLLLGAMLLGTASLFTACSDDRDSNPTLIQPTEFVVNTPDFINETVKLEDTKSVQLTWSQPQYTVENAPINATYEIQVSPTNSYTVTLADAEADESGATVADYAILDETFQTCKASIPTEAIQKAMQKIQGWDEKTTPKEAVAYIRVNAFIKEGSKKLYPIASKNVIEMKVTPYYIELKDAEPIMWYLVGNNFLDGAWGNLPGESSLPMMLVPGGTYDKKTGEGDITYTNYFTQDGWKIQPEDFNWDLGFMSDKAGGAIYRDNQGDNGDIKLGSEGYYKVTVTTTVGAPTCNIEKLDITPANYGTIALAGGFNDWKDTPMVSANKSGENHVWTYTLTTETGTELKFKVDGDANWTNKWGCKAPTQTARYMYGKGTQGGDNIYVPEGTWIITFNDIDGTFTMIKK